MSINTYYEWFEILEIFSAGDDSALEKILQGTFEINAGTYSNFYNKVLETYKKRKAKWLEKFQKPLISAKTENDFGFFLRDAKMNLEVIFKFINSQAFPNDLKETLNNDLELFVNDVKKSLSDNTQKSYFKGKDALLMQISSFGIYSLQNHLEVESKENEISTNQNNQFKGRKIIF